MQGGGRFGERGGEVKGITSSLGMLPHILLFSGAGDPFLCSSIPNWRGKGKEDLPGLG